MLLSRDKFRENVFARDNHKCVICGNPGQDAHHIIERRLFDNGGYFLDNGATVCGSCHLKCESTEISCEEVRQAAGIKKIILPDHLYTDQEYDKWGNPILPNGQRLRGELFEDASVQKILTAILPLFTNRVKYPRTYHLPWSPGMNDDDKQLKNTSVFDNKIVVVTEKLDGENTTWYSDYNHARSVDSRNHPSRNRAKSLWAERCGDIPTDWRIVVENLFAEHSIPYDNLEEFVYGLSIWDDKNYCLSWSETTEWFQLLNLPQPKVFYHGIYDEELIKNIQPNPVICEGYVLRVEDRFHYSQFRHSVAKYVRAGHVQTAKHWMLGQQIKENKLK